MKESEGNEETEKGENKGKEDKDAKASQIRGKITARNDEGGSVQAAAEPSGCVQGPREQGTELKKPTANRKNKNKQCSLEKHEVVVGFNLD